MRALICSQNWLKKDHTINLQEILEEVEKYEDITQGIIHKSFGLVIYIFVIYNNTSFLYVLLEIGESSKIVEEDPMEEDM